MRSLQIRQELTKVQGMSEIIAEKIDNSNAPHKNDSIVHMLPSEKLSIKFKTACLSKYFHYVYVILFQKNANFIYATTEVMSGPWKICNAIDSKIAFHFSNVGLPFKGSCPSEISILSNTYIYIYV